MKRKLGPDDGHHWETEEAGPTARPRTSEAYSDSTCDSGAMEVQRIHSGLPALPGTWKTEGAYEATGAEGRRSDDSDGMVDDGGVVLDRDGCCLELPIFERGQGTIEALQKCLPRSITNADHNSARQIDKQLTYFKAKRCAPPADESFLARRATQHARAFTALTSTALHQQMDLLEADEQALLAELRTVRREYDVRIAALQLPAAAQQQAALPPPRRLASAADPLHQASPLLPPGHHGFHGHPRFQLQLASANGRHLNLDAPLGLACGPVAQALGSADAAGATPSFSTSTSSVKMMARSGSAAPKGLMMPPPPPPQPQAQRWTAQGAAAAWQGAERPAPMKPPVAGRPNTPITASTPPCGAQAPVAGAETGAGGSARTKPAGPHQAPTKPADPTCRAAAADRPARAPLTLPPGVPSDGGPSGAVALPLSDTWETLLRNGGGSGPMVSSLVTHLLLRHRQQQAGLQ